MLIGLIITIHKETSVRKRVRINIKVLEDYFREYNIHGGENLMSVSICSKCDNFARCRKYCPYKAGESLALMLANIPTMETKIGM